MAKFITCLFMAIVLTAGSVMADGESKIKFKGDFRLRHEITDQEGKDMRNRDRIRARIYATGAVNDETKVVVGLSTGSNDPVSSNQTIGDGFSTKNIMLDLAYAQYNSSKLNGLTVIGGKMKNPFKFPGKSELIWDGDVRPEGAKVQLTHKADNMAFNILGSGLWIEENKTGDDLFLTGGQAYFTYNLDDKKGGVTLGGSYFSYMNIEGSGFVFDDGAFGNSEAVDTMISEDETDTTYTEIYAEAYDLFEVFGEFNYKFDDMPVKVIGDFVTNTSADSLNSGWLVGIYINKAKKPGSWELRYLYRNLEKDAVFGAYTDSDFRGGGTNGKGHEFGVGYQLLDNTKFAVSYLNNQIGIDEETQTDFQRWQIDLKFKF